MFRTSSVPHKWKFTCKKLHVNTLGYKKRRELPLQMSIIIAWKHRRASHNNSKLWFMMDMNDYVAQRHTCILSWSYQCLLRLQWRLENVFDSKNMNFLERFGQFGLSQDLYLRLTIISIVGLSSLLLACRHLKFSGKAYIIPSLREKTIKTYSLSNRNLGECCRYQQPWTVILHWETNQSFPPFYTR